MKLRVETVVVPYDFSRRCRVAAEHAVLLAERLAAKLLFVHVIPFSSFEYAAFEGGAHTAQAWPSEEEVRAKLESAVGELLAGRDGAPDSSIRVLKGDPAGEIAELADDAAGAMIVMPTHGFGAFRRFILGSVTTKVLHDVNCPVFTGAHLERDPVAPVEPYAHVACAIDLREHSAAVLSWAAEFARRFDAKLTAIHAVNWLETAPLDEERMTAELRERLIAGARVEAEDLIRRVGCDAGLAIDLDSAEKFVPFAVEQAKADILVVGRSLERGLIGKLREHSYTLIRESPVPVISV